MHHWVGIGGGTCHTETSSVVRMRHPYDGGLESDQTELRSEPISR